MNDHRSLDLKIITFLENFFPIFLIHFKFPDTFLCIVKHELIQSLTMKANRRLDQPKNEWMKFMPTVDPKQRIMLHKVHSLIFGVSLSGLVLTILAASSHSF